MKEKTTFQKVAEKNSKRLEQYVPIVFRVHGGNHPEFEQVQKEFLAISKKVKEAGNKKPDLKTEFLNLRQITHNYSIPEGVCESYEAVYLMLKELDEAYE